MKFESALKYLEDGKKIRRTCWEVGHFWKKEEFKGIVNSIGDTPNINVKQLQADDWEVYEEKQICLLSEAREKCPCDFCKQMREITNLSVKALIDWEAHKVLRNIYEKDKLK